MRGAQRFLLTLIAVSLPAISTGSVTNAQVEPEPDTQRPGAPPFVQAEIDAPGVVTLLWGRSTDDTGVASYRVLRNGNEVLRTPDARRAVMLDNLPQGDNYLQVQGIDAAGNESVRTAPILVTLDRQAPAVPTDITASFSPARQADDGFGSSISFRAAAPGDFVDYRVYSNGQELVPVRGALTTDSSTQRSTIVLPLSEGSNHLQLRAVDLAGNSSVKTAPVLLNVDTRPPSAPLDLDATSDSADVGNGLRSVEVTFALPDAGDVDACLLLRNLQNSHYSYFTPADAAVGNGRYQASDLTVPGTYFYQVVCYDAAENQSRRSAPVRVDVSGDPN